MGAFFHGLSTQCVKRSITLASIRNNAMEWQQMGFRYQVGHTTKDLWAHKGIFLNTLSMAFAKDCSDSSVLAKGVPAVVH